MNEITDTHELAPGIHRVETVEDDKLHGYHVLEGVNGPILVDSGYIDAPTEVYRAFLTEMGWSLQDVVMTVTTHADADHFGGNHALREHAPDVVLAGHIADVPLMESVERIMDERYGQFEEAHGISYGEDVIAWLTRMMGPDEPIDLGLRGGERLRIGERELTLLHTPGHTRGHLMLYDPTHEVVIGGDGFFGRGLFDVDGNYLQPPPYFLYPEYETTIQLVDSLNPAVLSFTHYEILRGEGIQSFVAESLDFITEIQSLALGIAEASGPITLQEAIASVVERRGSFGLDLDLAYPLSAHFRDYVRQGVLTRTSKDGFVAWTAAT